MRDFLEKVRWQLDEHHHIDRKLERQRPERPAVWVLEEAAVIPNFYEVAQVGGYMSYL